MCRERKSLRERVEDKDKRERERRGTNTERKFDWSEDTVTSNL